MTDGKQASSSLLERELPSIGAVSNPDLRRLVIDVWQEALDVSRWSSPSDCPFHTDYLADVCSITQHTEGVVRSSLAIAQSIPYDDPINFDLLTTGALLHDVCKLVEYEPNGSDKGKAILSEHGRRFSHATWGVHAILSRGENEIAHVVAAHTPALSTLPATPEALIVHHADFCDADLHRMRYGDPLFLSLLPWSGPAIRP